MWEIVWNHESTRVELREGTVVNYMWLWGTGWETVGSVGFYMGNWGKRGTVRNRVRTLWGCEKPCSWLWTPKNYWNVGENLWTRVQNCVRDCERNFVRNLGTMMEFWETEGIMRYHWETVRTVSCEDPCVLCGIVRGSRWMVGTQLCEELWEAIWENTWGTTWFWGFPWRIVRNGVRNRKWRITRHLA